MARRFLRLKVFNDILTVLNIGLAVYILVFPFLPNLKWWVQHDAPIRIGAPAQVTVPTSGSVEIDNTLFIPSIGLTEVVHEGNHPSMLDQGAWRRPQTSMPDGGSNTVIVAHRFAYGGGGGVFYHLDKVNKEDAVAVHWEGKTYMYKVVDKRVVPATAVEVEASTEEQTLTLYTCTPLWNPKDRLVITARLTEVL